MGRVDLLEMIAILLLTLIIYFITTYKSERELKLMSALSSVTFFIYSGIGIAFEVVSNKYMIHYFIFLTVWLVSMRIMSMRIAMNKNSELEKKTNEALGRYMSLYKSLTIVFFITQFMYLLVPEVRILDFFKPQNISIVGYFDKRQQTVDNAVLNISSLIGFIAQPFFFIYLHRLMKAEKKKTVLFLTLLWIYTDYLKINYISRYQMVIYFLFVFLLVFCTKEGKLKLGFKKFAALAIIFVVSVPFLSSFTETRMGIRAEERSFGDSLEHLIDSECGYPTNFELIAENTDAISPQSYFKWIFWLPVPSVIYPNKPTLNINGIYTYLRTGLRPGDSSFSIVLPSLLGESFLVWNMDFYWMTAIIIAFIIVFFHKFCLKYSDFYVIDLYFIIKILVLGRGGTASLIPELINSSLFVVLWVLFIRAKIWKNQKNILNKTDES